MGTRFILPILSLVLFLTSNSGFSQTCNPCYAIVDGGNWNSASSWSNTVGGGASTNIPGSTDTVYIGESGAMNINLAASADVAKLKVYGTGSLTYTASSVTLTMNNGDSLVVEDGGVIDGNNQTLSILTISGSSRTDVLLEGTGARINNLFHLYTQNSDTVFLWGSGDININQQLRPAPSSSVLINNLTGTISANFLFATSPNLKVFNNGTLNLSSTIRYISNNGQLINSDTITAAGINSNSNTDDGNIFSNSGHMEITGAIDPSDADWTIDNSGSFIHTGSFANTGGVLTINNLNGGTWFTTIASHAGITMNCDDAVNTFIFNGSGAQDVFVPSDGEYYNLRLTGSGAKTIAGAVVVQDTLFQDQGFVDISGNSITIGTAPGSAGDLVYVDGGFYGGDFTRFFAASTVADGDTAGFFPMANDGSEARPIFVSVPAVAPSTGGTITISKSNVTTVSDVSVADDATILRRYDGFWAMSSGGGLTGGTYNIRAGGLGFGEIGDVTDLRLMLSGSVVGSPGTNGGSTMNPEVNRTGLTLANLTNDFYLGSVAAIRSPLPISILSFESACNSGNTELNWKILRDNENENIRLFGSLNGLDWESLSFEEKGEDLNGVLEFSYSGRSSTVPEYFQLVDQDNEVLAEKKVSCDAFNEIRLFPNPSNGNFEIEGMMGIDKIEIWDTQGNLITSRDKRKERCYSDSFTMNLENGIYFVVLFGKNGEVIKSKLMIAD